MLYWPPHSLAPMPLIENRRSVPGPLMCTRSVASHQVGQGLHPGPHPRVVERADLEVEVLEGLRAHRAPAGPWPAVGQRRTTHFVLFTRWSMTGFISRLTSCTRDEGTSDGLEDVVRAAERDVGVHLLHPRELDLRERARTAPPRPRAPSRARSAPGGSGRTGRRPALPRGADERDHHGVRHVEGVDQHPLALLQGGREAGEALRKLREAGVDDHGEGPITPGAAPPASAFCGKQIRPTASSKSAAPRMISISRRR